jgi:serine/threonine-protein kinase
VTLGVHELSPVGRIGRFDILGRLAIGGMAEIFLAREGGAHGASREVVVKRVLPHVAKDAMLTDMFVQEARLCMSLRHPNICPIYEFGEHDGAFFLAMEWVHGVSLADIIHRVRRRGGTLPVPLAVKVIADIAAALRHAHAATGRDGRPLGIVHRDVTPENIVVGYDGVARLIDFGIAKAKSSQLDKTQAGVLKGKFAYMSPEQYQGEELDGRSDIFSLGVCLFEALTGQSLFDRGNEYETVAAIVLETDVPSIRSVRPDLSETLDGIVRRALARDREDRFASADEMHVALDRYLAAVRHVIRDTDIAAYVQTLFEDEYRRGPELDRQELAAPPSPRPPEPTPHFDELQRLAIGAEMEDAEEAFASAGRRKNLAIVLIALLVVVAILAVAGLALREGPPGSAAPDAPIDGPP